MYYLLLQDRIDSALLIFQQIKPEEVTKEG